MKKILLSLFATFFLYSSAQAFSIGFDPEGLGVHQDIERFTFTKNAELDKPAGAVKEHDLWSYENALGDFTETFTVQLDSADFTTGMAWDLSAYNIFADITLLGNINIAAGLATFSFGEVILYVDDGEVYSNNEDYDLGDDTPIAKLSLLLPGTMALNKTVLETGLEGDINLDFIFTETYVDFFDTPTDDLVAKGWLLSFIGEGDISVSEIVELANPVKIDGVDYTRAVGWSLSGISAEFTAIPEPTTMVLMGIGLLGLAGIGRKKSIEK